MGKSLWLNNASCLFPRDAYDTDYCRCDTVDKMAGIFTKRIWQSCAHCINNKVLCRQHNSAPIFQNSFPLYFFNAVLNACFGQFQYRVATLTYVDLQQASV